MKVSTKEIALYVFSFIIVQSLIFFSFFIGNKFKHLTQWPDDSAAAYGLCFAFVSIVWAGIVFTTISNKR